MRISIYSSFLLLFVVCYSDKEKKRLETTTGFISGSKLIKGSRNAIYFLDNEGSKHFFPDFYTFSTLGFAVSDIKKIPDEKLAQFPLGDPIKALPAPPPFRPDDAYYHDLCEDPKRLVRFIGGLNLGLPMLELG